MPGRVWERALQVAAGQHGFVTFADLRRLGSDPALLRQWSARGKIERVGHGIYRFALVPPAPLDPYRLATLWPSGRGVIGHRTALWLHGLVEAPGPESVTHVVVPPGYWPRRRRSERYRFHVEALGEDEVTRLEGVPIVIPRVAIRQGFADRLPLDEIQRAIERVGGWRALR